MAGQQVDEGLPFGEPQRIEQLAGDSIADLNQAQFRIEGIDANELRVQCQYRKVLPLAAQGIQFFVGGHKGRVNQVGCVCHHDFLNTCRPLKAWLSVPPSTNSSSPPTGTPWAIRDTTTLNSLSCSAMYQAVASPSTVGLLARMT